MEARKTAAKEFPSRQQQQTSPHPLQTSLSRGWHYPIALCLSALTHSDPGDRSMPCKDGKDGHSSETRLLARPGPATLDGPQPTQENFWGRGEGGPGFVPPAAPVTFLAILVRDNRQAPCARDCPASELWPSSRQIMNTY